MAKAKAFIKKYPAWTTVIIVLLAGVFMGAKWLEPAVDPTATMQFATVQRGNLRVTVSEGGALDSTRKLNLRCELDGGGTIVELVNEGTYVKGPHTHQAEEGDTLQSLTEKYLTLAQTPSNTDHPTKLQIKALEQSIQRLNPDVDWENPTLGETLHLPGDLLVKFEDGVLRERIFGQVKAVEDAERDLANSEKDLALRKIETAEADRQAELDVEFAEQDLAKYIEGTAPLARLALKGDIDIAEEEIKRAEDRLVSTKKLRAKGYATDLEVQADELTIQKQNNLITKYKKQMDLLERFDIPQMTKRHQSKLSQVRVSEQRMIEKSKAIVENQTEVVARRKAGLQAQRDKLDMYRDQLTKTELRAPQDGLVIFARSSSRYNESYIKLGADIRKGYNVIDLPDVSELMAVVQVHESYVRHLRTGLQAVVKIDSLPEQEFTGVVRKVAPTPDQRRSYYENISVYDTHVWIVDKEGRLPSDLKPGVSARAEIVIAELESVLKIPVQCVTTKGGKKVVQVKRGETVEIVPVETGQFSDRFIEIRSGLIVGDQVSLSPQIAEPTKGKAQAAVGQ
ncbi:MAG: HlyD family efflux transporter periplasmic adaptor subunit [Verrucomicrobia subdivision 3 bacterium]|nr:HlyD family efflux transporter periplasmic adaptor subunit [Limisphaerales bacterium]